MFIYTSWQQFKLHFLELMSWREDKEIIIDKYSELININHWELFKIIKDHIDDTIPILPLVEFILTRLDTVIDLAEEDKIWDAEIVLRSALETFTKLIFITTAEKEEQLKRIEEYWISLAEINSLKMSDQARRNLEHFGYSEAHRIAYLPLILPEEHELALKSKWTKVERQKVEQKWSFSEMIFSISKSHKGTPLEMLITLTHSYRMSSHVMHGDEMGIKIIKERERRSEEERDKANIGHYLRLLSDSLTYSAFVSIETMSFLKLKDKRKFFMDNHKQIEEIKAITEKYEGRVFDDPDYDKYRS